MPNFTDLFTKEYYELPGSTSPTTTKGDLIVRGETSDTRLPVGAENTFLSPDPNDLTGLTWKNPVLGGAMLFDNAIESVQVITPSLANGESVIVYADISRTYLLTKIEEIYSNAIDAEIFSNEETNKIIATYTNFTTQDTSLLGYIDQPSLGNKVPLRVTNRSGSATTLTLNLDVIKTSATNLNLAKGLDNPPKYITIVTGTLAVGASEVVSVDFPRVYILSDLQANVDCTLKVHSQYNPSAFSPLTLQPSLWLDANDASTVTIVDSSVSEWRDKSGNNRHATQATATRRPLLESVEIGNTITFDGIDDLLQSNYSINGLVSAELFVISSIPTINTGVVTGEYLVNSPNQGFILGSSNTTATLGGRTHGSSYISSSLTYTPSTYNILQGKIENTGITAGANGVLASKTTYSVETIISGDNFNIGCNNGSNTLFQPSNPKVSQIIAFSRILTQTEREQVEGYLAWITGLQTNLPTGHPYKNNPVSSNSLNLLQTYTLTANTTQETNLLGFNEDPADSQVKLEITNNSGIEQAITVEAELVEMQPATPNYKFDNAPTEITVTTGTLTAGASEIVTLPYPRVCVLSDLTADINCDVEFYSRYSTDLDNNPLQSYTLTANTTLETNLLTFNEDPNDSFLKAKITNTTASPAAITLTTEIIPVFSPTGMTWRVITGDITAETEVGYFVDTNQATTITLPNSPAIGSSIYVCLLQATTVTLNPNGLNITGSSNSVDITTVGEYKLRYSTLAYGWTLY